MPSTNKIEFKTGAVRDNIGGARFDLIDPYGLERLAWVCGDGARAHGERNWELGMPTSDIMNHAMKHLNDYMAGARDEDYPAKIAWAMFAIMRMEEVEPHFCNLPGDKHGT